MNESDYMDWLEQTFSEDEILEQERDEYWRPFVDDDLAFLLECE